MKDFRIAAVQMNGLLGRVEENLAVHERYVARAAEAGAQLVIFPECSVEGQWCEPGSSVAAEPVPDGPSSKRLLDLARRHGLYVGYGLAESAAGAVYNTYAIVGPGGFVGLQRKVHPSGDEYFFFRAGSSFDVFDLPFGRLGVNICADNVFPESSRVCALKGAELLIAPHAARCGAAPKDVEEERVRVRDNMDYYRKRYWCRVVDNGFFLVYVNQSGVAGQVKETSAWTGTRDVVHAGGIMVFKPDGSMLAESKSDRFGEEMVVTDPRAEDLVALRGRKCFGLLTRRPGAYGIIADTTV
jgi:predicted amidohydrolase